MTVPVTGITPVYGIEYLEEGEPVRHTRAKLQRNAEQIEAALQATGVVPAPGINAVVAAATASPTPDTLARRDAAGTFEVTAATTAAHPYRKDQVDNLMAQVPALDELFTSTYLGSMATGSYFVFVAPYALRIAAAEFVCNTAVASSAANYATLNLRRGRAASYTTFATKTTYAGDGAGGQALAAGTAWNFDAISFGAARDFAKGDIMVLQLTTTGTVTTPLAIGSLTVRYTPL
jgi:hypothetical protein